MEVVRRWNREYAGEAAGSKYSSVVVKVEDASDTSGVIAAAAKLGLVPHDTRARDVSVLITGVLAILLLVAGVILLVAALNIAHTFRVLVAERQHEIGLYRALGASAGDMRAWLTSLALVVGALGGASAPSSHAWRRCSRTGAGASTCPISPSSPTLSSSSPGGSGCVGIGFAAVFACWGHRVPRAAPPGRIPAEVLGRDR